MAMETFRLLRASRLLPRYARLAASPSNGTYFSSYCFPTRDLSLYQRHPEQGLIIPRLCIPPGLRSSSWLRSVHITRKCGQMVELASENHCDEKKIEHAHSFQNSRGASEILATRDHAPRGVVGIDFGKENGAMQNECSESKDASLTGENKVSQQHNAKDLLSFGEGRTLDQSYAEDRAFSDEGKALYQAKANAAMHNDNEISAHLIGDNDELKDADAVGVELNMDMNSYDDETSLMIVDVACKLGIENFEGLCTIESVRNSTDTEVFKRLSFLTSIGISGKMLARVISMEPAFMSMNLGKKLNPVIERLESLGMQKSFIGKMLIVEPELLHVLAEKALQLRVRALRKLDFSREDCASVLKKLQYKQVGQFLRCNVETLDKTFTFVTDDIEIKKSDAIKLLSGYPSILLRDAEREFRSKMSILHSVFGDSRLAKRMFIHFPELLGRKTEALEETLNYWKSMCNDSRKLSKLLQSYPIMLTHTRSAIEQVSNYLQSLGITGPRLLGLIAREPYLVTCEVGRLQKHVEFLKSKNLDEQAICNLIECSTGMFFRSVEKRVVHKLEFLESQGIMGGTLQKLMKSKPHVYQKSLRKTITPNLEFLLSLGFKENSSALKDALKISLLHSQKSMQSRIDYLVGLGIEAENVHKIVRENSSILVSSMSSLKKKVEFLLKVMKHPIDELAKCPAFLVSDMDNVIKPRVRVLQWLKSQGLKKHVSLSTVVEATEAVFLKQFVEAHPEAFSIYKGTQMQS